VRVRWLTIGQPATPSSTASSSRRSHFIPKQSEWQKGKNMNSCFNFPFSITFFSIINEQRRESARVKIEFHHMVLSDGQLHKKIVINMNDDVRLVHMMM
jgi:hypothetical protein